MRESLALVLLLAIGCSSARAPVNRETRASLPAGQFVTLPRLANNLDLIYRGERAGFIELSARPDAVMLVRNSTRARVNGHVFSMEYPCMQRGEDFVITRNDAAKVTRRLNEFRSSRRVVEPPPSVVRPKPQPVVGAFPSKWRPRRDVRLRPWRYIVVHHMASGRGSASVIHRMHKNRGYNGLGYHFVIGNGTVTADGEVEVGYRWVRQIEGAHARAKAGDDNRWNERGIGVCLVGDFQGSEPSDRQLAALSRLVRLLQKEYGIASSNVVPHRYVKPTLCPGQNFPWEEFKASLR